MTRPALLIGALAAFALSVGLAAIQPFEGEVRECYIRMLDLSHGMHNFAHANQGAHAPDLASVVALLWAERGQQLATPADAIRYFAMTPSQVAKVPDDATIDWVNANSSYIYNLPPGINFNDIPAWDKVIVAHLRPELAHQVEPSERNPEGELITVALMMGAGVPLTRQEFAQRMAMSDAILHAVVSGDPFPDSVQMQADLQKIGEAISAYAGAHEGRLPLDLGSLLPFVPSQTKRLATIRDRARIFLAPHAARNTHIPEEPDAEWINRHTVYIYLGNPAASLSEIDDMRLVLVHAKFDAHLGIDPGGKPIEEIPLHTVRNGFESAPRPYAEARIREARDYFEALAAGRELPDAQHMLRDLRYIYRAVLEYGKAHDGRLPPDLGATVEYLPDDEFTAANAANIYLSPRAQRGRGEVPAQPTPEWVREHGNYIYVGDATLTRPEFNREFDVLVHAPRDETVPVLWPHTQDHCIPTLRPDGIVWKSSLEVLEEDLQKLRKPR
jgi:hypothetical protein